MAAIISFAVTVYLFDSRANSFARVAKYMQKMPHTREKAMDASLPTLVDLGREFFRIRRMHASGGSNSLFTPAAVACWLPAEVVTFSAAVEYCVDAAGATVVKPIARTLSLCFWLLLLQFWIDLVIDCVCLS